MGMVNPKDYHVTSASINGQIESSADGMDDAEYRIVRNGEEALDSAAVAVIKAS